MPDLGSADRLESGFDERFYQWFRNWVGEAWPFASLKVAWPGREIPWISGTKSPARCGRQSRWHEPGPGRQHRRPATEEKLKLRREFRFGDMFFFYIAAIVVIDTIGQVAASGAQGFTWLVFLGLFWFGRSR